MALSEDSLRDRLTRHLASYLNDAHVAPLAAEIERLGLVPTVTALVQELEDVSPKVARAATEALPELHSRVGLDDLDSWLDLAVGNRYQPAVPALERFLTVQGRRKFVRPLITALAKDAQWGRPIAARIYAKARPSYHSVTASDLDELGLVPTGKSANL